MSRIKLFLLVALLGLVVMIFQHPEPAAGPTKLPVAARSHKISESTRISSKTNPADSQSSVSDKEAHRRRLWEKMNPPFANSLEVGKFLASAHRTPVDFAMCGVMARRPDLINDARLMDPDNEAIHLIWFLSNSAKNVTPEAIEDFKKRHPESAWPSILSANLEIKKQDAAKTLELLSGVSGGQNMLDTGGMVKESFTDFLMEIKGASLREAENKQIADLENFACSYSLCKNLISDLVSLSTSVDGTDPTRSKELLVAAWDIADHTKNWDDAVQTWTGLEKQNEIAQKVGYVNLASLLQQDPTGFETSLLEAIKQSRADFTAVRQFRQEASDPDFFEFLALSKKEGEVTAYKTILENTRNGTRAEMHK